MKQPTFYNFTDCPAISGIKQSPEYRVVETFASNEYWKEQFDDLFAPDVHIEYPYAPPGMFQYFSPFEFGAHRYWLRNIVKTWTLTKPATIIPTSNPGLFWVVRFVSAEMVLAKRPGHFEAEILSRIEVRNGKITSLREYEDPLAYYRALDDVLPTFYYVPDLAEAPPTFRMSADAVSKFSAERNKARAVAMLSNPITGYDGDPEPLYSHDVVQVLPFAHYDQYRVNRGINFDRNIEWMLRIVKFWNTIEKSEVYESVDPKVFVVGSYGYGELTWGFRPGHYIQREFMTCHVNQAGKIEHLRVYFNPMMKFTSTNVRIPTVPYFNF